MVFAQKLCVYSGTSQIRLSKIRSKCILFGRYLIWEVLHIAAKLEDHHKFIDFCEGNDFRACITQKEHKCNNINIFSFLSYLLHVLAVKKVYHVKNTFFVSSSTNQRNIFFYRMCLLKANTNTELLATENKLFVPIPLESHISYFRPPFSYGADAKIKHISSILCHFSVNKWVLIVSNVLLKVWLWSRQVFTPDFGVYH